MLIGSWNPSLVLVSALVAVFASCTTLSVAGRSKQAHGYASWAWTAGGALAMGVGINTMHYTGMAAACFPPAASAWPSTAGSIRATWR